MLVRYSFNSMREDDGAITIFGLASVSTLCIAVVRQHCSSRIIWHTKKPESMNWLTHPGLLFLTKLQLRSWPLHSCPGLRIFWRGPKAGSQRQGRSSWRIRNKLRQGSKGSWRSVHNHTCCHRMQLEVYSAGTCVNWTPQSCLIQGVREWRHLYTNSQQSLVWSWTGGEEPQCLWPIVETASPSSQKKLPGTEMQVPAIESKLHVLK